MRFRERPQIDRAALAALRPKAGDRVQWMGQAYIVTAVGLRYARVQKEGSQGPTEMAPLNEVVKL